MTTNLDEMASEQVARIAELKRKMLEFVDYITTWEEAELAKRTAKETPIQDD